MTNEQQPTPPSPSSEPQSAEVSRSSDRDAAQPSANFPEAIAEMGFKLGEIVGGTALGLGKAAVDTAAGVGGVVTHTALHTGKAIVDTASGVGETITRTTAQNGKTAIETATAVGEVLGSATAHASRTAVDMATWMGDLTKWFGEATAKQLYTWLEQTTQGTGQAVTFVGSNPLVRRLSGVLKLDWLVGISDRVDLDQAQAEVKRLQQKYPDESPNQIAHRIMVEKAVYAGGIGLASSFIPGAAAALLAVDLAATTAMQTEMLYQIAAAYGLDLKDPARRGEVLAIFGLAMGGSKAMRAGLGFLRNVPVAGALIGASTNATMLYTLGYAACRFYEEKLKGDATEPAIDTLETLKQESDRYLEVAMAQQAVMDQILVHMVLASYPDRKWEDALPYLKRLQLNESSLEAIAANIQSPQPLSALLGQLNHDFAIPLMAQCYRLSQTDGVSGQEREVLDAIAEKFGLDVDAIAQSVREGKSIAEIDDLHHALRAKP